MTNTIQNQTTNQLQSTAAQNSEQKLGVDYDLWLAESEISAIMKRIGKMPAEEARTVQEAITLLNQYL